MKRYIFILLLILFFSCQREEKHAYSFYFWRTELTLNEKEKGDLQKAELPFLYTHFFDIDKIDGKFQPIGVITKNASFNTNKKIVPVVFIKNELFYYIKPEEINFLVKNILMLINRKKIELKLNTSNEIQIDCDWNQGTKDDYFTFLKELKTVSKKNITSTLRLHQIKDKNKMGIPPVEKVYLMCYSTSSPLENSKKNSILDVATLKNYLKNVKNYPLKMDVALPIYSWGIITNHLGKHKIINALTVSELENSKNFKKINENTFEILADDFYFGMYLNKGFKIKVEGIPEETLQQTIDFLDQKINYNYNIVYYHLDSNFTKNYPHLLKK